MPPKRKPCAGHVSGDVTRIPVGFLRGQRRRSWASGRKVSLRRIPEDPAHLVSWIALCRSARQSGARHGKGKQKKGNSYGAPRAGQAAIGASGTATFLGERYRRIARRRGKAIAQAAVARSIMIIVSLAGLAVVTGEPHVQVDPVTRHAGRG